MNYIKRANSKQNELIECELWFIRETDNAIKISSDETEDDACWLPKKHIEYDKLPDQPWCVITISVPERLLTEKGLV